MALWTDLVKPVQLTGVAREVIGKTDAGAETLADIFPNRTVPDTTFSWVVNGRANDVAQYRAFDAEAAIGGKSGMVEKTARLAPMSLKKRFGELDAIRRMAPNSPESVVAGASRLAAEVAQSFVSALVLHRSAALIDGKLSIRDDESGFIQEVDFGRRPDHTAVAAEDWATSADPIAQLEEWRDAFEEHTGVTPTKLKMGRAAASALTRNASVRVYLGTNAPTSVSDEDVNRILGTRGLPQMEVVSALVGGVQAFKPGHIVLAADQAGLTPWGLTKSAGDSRFGLGGGDLPGMIVGAYQEDDPAIEWIIGNATVVPILTDPDLTFSAKVLGV